MLSARERFVEIAESQIGVREKTPNRSPEILLYRDATSLGRDGLPDASWYWCSAFVCWAQQQFMQERMPTLLSLRNRSAGAHSWETWKFPGVQVKDPKKHLARAGDIVTFEFDGDATAEHVGIVAKDQTAIGADIVTVEGNTRPGTAARDGGGATDGVYRMTRKVKLVRKFISWLT